ncbi:MAG: diaminopimelate epimerase [Acidimicrobiaceae bacterium]|nr:diaminopimelate epimerase [Acidimicrobiaceae bacterium]
MRLHKLHGLGNDFLIRFVDAMPSSDQGAHQALKLCDRKEGVGADGLIYAVVDPPGLSGMQQAPRRAAMRLWNSDGSHAEVSGNGLRCLTHAIAHETGVAQLDVTVSTVAGPRRCTVAQSAAAGTVFGVTEMGSVSDGPRPDLAGCDPVAALGSLLGPQELIAWVTLDVGNPHIVFYVEKPEMVRISSAGPAVESVFSSGINVHFATVAEPDWLTLAVWERGAGATGACGTGAVAAAAAFHRWGVVGQRVSVGMDGGHAEVDLAEPVTLQAESAYVAAVEVPDFAA